jgi:glycosyltransferase involved in cell wall biosynthesis
MTLSQPPPQSFAAFTIVAHNFLPRARLLASSFAKHHPQAAFFIVVIDYPMKIRLRQRDDPSLVAITDIDFGPEGFEMMATGYDVTEFATSIKPFALRHLLAEHDCVLYLDPDIEVYSPLDPIVEATREHGISLTPHCLQPIKRDGCQPSEPGLLAAGVYNLGYVGVARKSIAFVDWWAERLRRDALNDAANFIFTDQKWIDLSVPIFRPHIESDPGYNVAYWNVDQRPISYSDGQFRAGDTQLRFFHFSGFDPARPHWISKYQPVAPRIRMSDSPDLIRLFSDYATRLIAATDAEPPLPYGWGEAFPGFELTGDLRRAFHHDLRRADDGLCEPPPTPFVKGGAERFLSWASAMPEDDLRPIPRYLRGIWNERPDVRILMPETVDGDIRRLRTWAKELAGAEHPNLALMGWRPEAERRLGMVEHTEGTETQGVNLVGYLTADLGVGEAGRLAGHALRAADVSVATVETKRTLSRRATAFSVDATMAHNTVLMAVNADQTQQIRCDLGPEFFEGRYVIGQWFWEISKFPASYSRSFGLVDEVWAATKFVQQAMEAASGGRVPVTHMRLPVLTPEIDASLTRSSFGLDDRYMFLFSFDMMSVIDRKNPFGLVDAYRTAFAANDGATLVLKTMNGKRNADGLERLKWSTADRPDIVVIDEAMDQLRSHTLMALCDCYVSLHRAEGLGLTMAEGMLLEKPVIATAYSGNMDFMDNDVAFLVDWTLADVGQNGHPYPASAQWAQPDLDQASATMRRVADEPTHAMAIGRAARLRLLHQLSPEACGSAMRQRLEEIWRNRCP